ncbi:MAG: UMP kinase [Candidatus Kerfeldbacteria bacterium]|nr:UMP kinase [Candidatus Kerfeldbacteria bacterium]
MTTEPMVISLGGSVLVPNGLDSRWLRGFVRTVRQIARRRQVVIIAGGGSTARKFVAGARAAGISDTRSLHWIGVRACQLNAAVLRAAFGLSGELVTDRTTIARRRDRIMIVAPSVPGTTSDYGSVLLARQIKAGVIFNVTNVDGVYTADPKISRSARRIDEITWSAFMKMFGRSVKPGMHVPFDPVASRLAARSGLSVVVMSSRLTNLRRAISGQGFQGTVIRPA